MLCRLPVIAIALAASLAMCQAHADEVTTFTLENGMNAVVIEDHRAPAVTHMVWYRAGSADEQRGKSGLAHYLEHLMFKGTNAFPEGQFSKMVSANGGYDNAFTSKDQTVYLQRLAADRLELVMQMEADRMRNLILSDSDAATELQVILEERAQRIDSSPMALFSEQLDAAQYLNHPYGTPTIGWRTEIEALTRQDALGWYRRFYAPNNATLIVAGDVDPDTVRALAEKYYGPVAPSQDLTERRRPAEPPQLAERRLSFTDANITQPYLLRSYLAPERDPGAQQEAAALTILAALLGGDSQTSILSRALTFDSQTAVSVGASYSGTSFDDTTFSIYVAPAPGVSLAQAEAALDTVLQTVLDKGIDDAQFDRLKSQIQADLIYKKDDVGQLANEYGMAITSGLTVGDVEAWPDILKAVTERDVLDVVKEVLDRRHSVTGWAMPPNASEVLQ